MNINPSKGERKIEDILKQNKISFQREVSFNDLHGLGNNLLRFDFAIFKQDQLICLIEYDGEQHFKKISLFDKDEDSFLIRRAHDLIKNKYCFDNDIPLIRIPYDADYTIDDLKLETTRFLLTPENEKEYYESRT